MIVAEYVWIDSSGLLRSKARTVKSDNILKWNFDGSSTGDAIGNDSEVILIPRKNFKDPFRKENNLLVLCDCYDRYNNPIASNTRAKVFNIFENNRVKREKPWYGFEQEYVLYDITNNLPLGWSINLEPQGKYYCGVGANRVFGRKIVEEHYKKCLYSGINISGVNAEVMPGQWEYQVGPCEGIDAGDQVWMSRYILHRVCEKYNVYVSFNPKPVSGDWNGSGLHTNFSTQSMRDKDGLEYIYKAINKLSEKHKEHLSIYGDNSKRLTGQHETSDPDNFTFGVADRSASIRIPLFTEQNKCGYLEDRRPASDADPYLISAKLVETILL